MSSEAASKPGPGGAMAAPKILTASDRFEMRGVHATSDATQMIQLQSGRKGAVEALPNKSVGHPAAAIDST